ncbi:hypothetical protein BsWGS_22946 [Bradybaena similaris]
MLICPVPRYLSFQTPLLPEPHTIPNSLILAPTDSVVRVSSTSLRSYIFFTISPVSIVIIPATEANLSALTFPRTPAQHVPDNISTQDPTRRNCLVSYTHPHKYVYRL